MNKQISIPRLQTLITSMIKGHGGRMSEIENEIGMSEKELERDLDEYFDSDKLQDLIDLNFHFGKSIGLKELSEELDKYVEVK